MWVCASGIYKQKNADGTEKPVNNMSDGFGGIMDFLNNSMTGGFAGTVTQGRDGDDDIRRNDYHG